MTEFIEELFVEIDLLPNYVVSNYGRIVNVSTGKELKPIEMADGHLKVGLYHAGKRHWVLVHRVVAKAFFLHYKDGMEVKHENGILSDNSVKNLTLNGKPCRTPSQPAPNSMLEALQRKAAPTMGILSIRRAVRTLVQHYGLTFDDAREWIWVMIDQGVIKAGSRYMLEIPALESDDV